MLYLRLFYKKQGVSVLTAWKPQDSDGMMVDPLFNGHCCVKVEGAFCFLETNLNSLEPRLFDVYAIEFSY